MKIDLLVQKFKGGTHRQRGEPIVYFVLLLKKQSKPKIVMKNQTIKQVNEFQVVRA
jgi:hypothetical protein